MNYWRIKKYDVGNGVGLRTSIWFTGCKFHCKGCFNESLWDFNSGKPFDKNAEDELFNLLSDVHCKGLSVLGGEPLEQGEELYNLLKKVKEMYPPKNIWLWTGYIFEDAIKDDIKKKILDLCDFVVDGRFEQNKKPINKKDKIKFRGSSNQRIFENKNGVFELVNEPEKYFK